MRTVSPSSYLSDYFPTGTVITARAESMNATTSASSNSTTRALILWRVIMPASAQRKIVRGQMPNRPAIDLALLNLRPPTLLFSASLPINDFVVVCMDTFWAICHAPTIARVYPIYGRPPTPERVGQFVPPSLIGHPQLRSVWLVHRNTSALVLVIDAIP